MATMQVTDEQLAKIVLQIMRSATAASIVPTASAAPKSESKPFTVASSEIDYDAMGPQLREVSDEAWAAASVVDRRLTSEELTAINHVSAQALKRLNKDGYTIHPANTVRLAVMRRDKSDPANQEAVIGAYHTDADGNDCAAPTMWTLAEFEQLFSTQKVLAEGLTQQQRVWFAVKSESFTDQDGVEHPVRPVAYSRTFVYPFTLGGSKQLWRVFAPASVTDLIIDRMVLTSKNYPTPQKLVWDRLIAPLYRERGLTLPMTEWFTAIVRMVRKVQDYRLPGVIAAGRFSFDNIRRNREEAISSAISTLNLVQEDRQNVALIERLINSYAEFLNYRIQSETRRNAERAERQAEQTPALVEADASSSVQAEPISMSEIPF